MQKDRTITILHEAPEPPAYLAGRILRSIEQEERKKLHRQIAVSGMFLFVSVGSTIMSLMSLGTELSHSGFLAFASLFSSDFSFAMANLRELFLSLVESFPAFSVAFCLASVGFAVWFGARLLRETVMARRTMFSHPSFS
jgi:hypothetical protein